MTLLQTYCKMKSVAPSVCHVSPNLQSSANLSDLVQLQIIYIYIATVCHLIFFIRLQFKFLSAGSDQGITQQAAVFQEASATFSIQAWTRRHTQLLFKTTGTKACALQTDSTGRGEGVFFSILYTGVSSPYSPEPRMMSLSKLIALLCLRNGNAFTQWVSPECDQVNMADSHE